MSEAIPTPPAPAERRRGIPPQPLLTRLPRRGVLLLLLLATVAAGGQDDRAPATPSPSLGPPSLTEDERAWLRAHPVIRVVQDPGWPPVEFADERGEPSGIVEDYLKLIEQRLGVKFERVRNLSWQEAYARLKRWDIDMTTSVTVTPERTEFWAFTKPYMRVPVVIVAQPDITYIGSMRELAGKTVAIVEGYAVNDWIPRDFPKVRLHRVKTVRDGLEALQQGKVFAYIETMLAVDYYKAKLGLEALKIVGQTPYVNVQSMAVRKDWPILASILDKTLDSISETERDAIYRKWLPIRYEQGFNYTRFWQVFALFTAIILGLMLWNRKLSHEIRRRKVAEAASIESEQRFEATFEQAAMGIAMVAPDGRWLRVNRKLCQIVGYSPEEMLALTFQDITHPDDLDADLDFVRRMLASEIQTYSMEKRYRRKEGGIVWINLTVSLVWKPDATPDYFISVIEDIQARKQTAAALRESEERLHLFIEHAPAALAMFDREMRYLVVSRRWMDDYSLGNADIIGRFHYEIFPEISDDLKAVHQRGLAGEVMRADDDRFVRADGHVQWLRWEMRPWHSGDGGVGGIVIFSEDISDHKQAEEEIHRLNADLERRVVERTAELSAANRELDSFAYAVSHDLRAPLRAMSGFGQALAEDYGDRLPDEAKGYLAQIGLASRRMNELIDGLLALSRSTRGGLRRDAVDLSTLAKLLLAELAQSEPERRVTVDVEAGLRARGDAGMMQVVLRNLLGNAWKYSAHAAKAHIRVYAEDRDGQRRLCVADNGAGFDMAYANRLFQPFQRLHRQEEFPGIGIGLATVQRIVHRHGGVIEAWGAPGKGATFCFTLPEAPADSMPSEEERTG
ncbi:MAG: PAS domain S-box protein [Candidatus Competibacter sp.]|nr:PAS domain S-box protein [Candidatus Competibacter sp.]MDG4584186.1 PAS domain S-box protein [Candidatus Competibacter sp.]